METLYVTFNVIVSDSKYTYSGKQGNAEVVIQVPRAILESINPGNLFIGAMQAALVNFDTPEPEDEETD